MWIFSKILSFITGPSDKLEALESELEGLSADSNDPLPIVKEPEFTEDELFGHVNDLLTRLVLPEGMMMLCDVNGTLVRLNEGIFVPTKLDKIFAAAIRRIAKEPHRENFFSLASSSTPREIETMGLETVQALLDANGHLNVVPKSELPLYRSRTALVVDDAHGHEGTREIDMMILSLTEERVIHPDELLPGAKAWPLLSEQKQNEALELWVKLNAAASTPEVASETNPCVEQ